MTTININDTAINVEMLRGYHQEALVILRKDDSLKEEWKMLVETVADTTKIPKKDVSAYFKARFKEATKEATAKGELFEMLDEALA